MKFFLFCVIIDNITLKYKENFMDTYSEQLVKKTMTSMDSLKKTLFFVGGVILAIVFLILTFTLSPFMLFAVAIVIYGIYWLMTGTNVEYEYIVTNGEIDIDKIISQRKRVNLLSVSAKEITNFGVYEDQNFDGTTISAIGGEEQLMYADFKSSKYGECRLVFAPNEKTLESIKPFLRIRK